MRQPPGDATMGATREQQNELKGLLGVCVNPMTITVAGEAMLADLLLDLEQDDLAAVVRRRGRPFPYPLWVQKVEDRCRERGLLA